MTRMTEHDTLPHRQEQEDDSKTSNATTPTQLSVERTFADRIGLRRLNAIYLLAFFAVMFTLLNPGVFLTQTTMVVVFNGGVVTCLIALGFLIPLTTASYDLSVGAMMTFSLVLMCQLSLQDMSLPLTVVITLLACATVGFVSGFVVVRLHVNSFIATLGMSQVLLALILIISNNQLVIGSFPEMWSTLGNGRAFGLLPYPLLFLLVVAGLLWFVLEHTRLGRYMFATGGNPEAARLSGVNTERMVWGSLVGSALLAGTAGIIYSMQVGVATSTIGSGLLFPACTAVFLGAAQLSLRPNVWGTLIAYFALAFGISGLRLTLGAGAAWAAPLFEGVALIIAVAVASRPIRARLTRKRVTADEQTNG